MDVAIREACDDAIDARSLDAQLLKRRAAEGGVSAERFEELRTDNGPYPPPPPLPMGWDRGARDGGAGGDDGTVLDAAVGGTSARRETYFGTYSSAGAAATPRRRAAPRAAVLANAKTPAGRLRALCVADLRSPGLGGAARGGLCRRFRQAERVMRASRPAPPPLPPKVPSLPPPAAHSPAHSHASPVHSTALFAATNGDVELTLRAVNFLERGLLEKKQSADTAVATPRTEAAGVRDAHAAVFEAPILARPSKRPPPLPSTSAPPVATTQRRPSPPMPSTPAPLILATASKRPPPPATPPPPSARSAAFVEMATQTPPRAVEATTQTPAQSPTLAPEPTSALPSAPAPTSASFAVPPTRQPTATAAAATTVSTMASAINTPRTPAMLSPKASAAQLERIQKHLELLLKRARPQINALRDALAARDRALDGTGAREGGGRGGGGDAAELHDVRGALRNLHASFSIAQQLVRRADSGSAEGDAVASHLPCAAHVRAIYEGLTLIGENIGEELPKLTVEERAYFNYGGTDDAPIILAVPIVPHAASATCATPASGESCAAVVDALRVFIAQRRRAGGDRGANGVGATVALERLATVAGAARVDSWRAFAEEAAARQISFDDFITTLRDATQLQASFTPPPASSDGEACRGEDEGEDEDEDSASDSDSESSCSTDLAQVGSASPLQEPESTELESTPPSSSECDRKAERPVAERSVAERSVAGRQVSLKQRAASVRGRLLVARHSYTPLQGDEMALKAGKKCVSPVSLALSMSVLCVATIIAQEDSRVSSSHFVSATLTRGPPPLCSCTLAVTSASACLTGASGGAGAKSTSLPSASSQLRTSKLASGGSPCR